MIEVDNLTKRFGSHTAVDRLSFQVAPGEVLGFLGPNGAGKSTTMKMLTGFLPPTSGTARIAGHDVQARPIEAKRQLGYLPEGSPGYGDMTVAEFLSFIADIRGLSGIPRQERLRWVIDEIHLNDVLAQRIETLSKGFRRRVGLAQAILHDPPVLILDEPTDGLDPNQKHEVRSLIQGMAKDKLIIISTHILEEVEAVCTRAIIIASGRLLVDDTPEALLSRSPYHGAVAVSVNDPEAAQPALESLPESAGVERRDGTLVVKAQPGQSVLPGVHRLVTEQGWTLTDVRPLSARLDEVFREITGGEAA
jgi:ABC-2 type transport system ATP-binding protein